MKTATLLDEITSVKKKLNLNLFLKVNKEIQEKKTVGFFENAWPTFRFILFFVLKAHKESPDDMLLV